MSDYGVILKHTYKLLAALAVCAALALPRVDAFFSATMPRKGLAEPLLLVFLGCAASRFCGFGRPASLAPAMVAAATLLLLFWMIPRSIDLTQIYPGVNALYVLSLFAAGLLLSYFLPLLPGVAKGAYGLCFSSMIVAFGFLYASQSTLFCSAYTLEDQHAFGKMAASLGFVMYMIVLARLTTWLTPHDASSGLDPVSWTPDQLGETR